MLDYENDELEEGDAISCFDCDAELEVVGTNPVDLRVIRETLDDEEEAGSDNGDYSKAGDSDEEEQEDDEEDTVQ